MTEAEVLTAVREATRDDVRAGDHNVLQLIHDYPAMVKTLYTEFLQSNISVEHFYRGTLRLEREVVGMIADFLGSVEPIGDIVSGGTEGNILSMRAAKKTYNKIRPNIVAPETAHYSFSKGAELMGIELRMVPVNRETWVADPETMEESIDDNTIGLVGSFGTGYEGAIDPIPEIAAVAKRHGISMHVDACWGGFIAPFFKALGKKGIPDFDFRVDGVTTIACDPHKMLYAPMPAGGVFYRDESFRDKVIFRTTIGGRPYTSRQLLGSRSGSAIVATWALLKYHGYSGFLKTAKIVLELTEKVASGVREIEGLRLVLEPKLNIIAVAADVPAQKIVGEMEKKGWRMYKPSENVPCFRLVVMPQIAPGIDRLIQDLRQVVKDLLPHHR